jgi:hypothetical protein
MASTIDNTKPLTNSLITSAEIRALATAASNDIEALQANQGATAGLLSKSLDYTTILTDANKQILHPSSDTSARVFTIAANSSVAYPLGTTLTFSNQDSAGNLTIAISSDTMRLAGAGTAGSRTLAPNGIAIAIKLATTEWLIYGFGLT